MVNYWSDEELSAAVEAYKFMAELEANSIAYSKKLIYRELAEKYKRSEKSYEYRMQNISSVLNSLEKKWIPGLKPAGNVGSKVYPRIVNLIGDWDIETTPTIRKIPFYKKILPEIRYWLIEVAKRKNPVTYGQVMDVFNIDRFSLRHAMDFLGHESEKLNEPIITALIINKKTRKCSKGLEDEFGVHDDEAERRSLYDFWSDKENALKVEASNIESISVKAARFVSVEARPDQAAFRNKVYIRCLGKCVISGCDVIEALDAAHKQGRFWKLGHNTASDGYLMRKDLHALYDKQLLNITEHGIIKLDDSVMEHYKDLAGKLIKID